MTDLPTGKDLEAAAPPLVRDLFASFQKAVVDFLVHRTIRAVERTGVSMVTVTGGVACNSRLRADLSAAGQENGFAVAWPRPAYCSDNGAMVAAAGCLLLRQGRLSDLDLDAVPSLALGE